MEHPVPVDRLVVVPCIAYCLCSRVASVDVVVHAPAILCFAPLSIVTQKLKCGEVLW